METDYGHWLSSSQAGAQELAAMRLQSVGLRYLPLVSLALVVGDHDEVWIKKSVDSVLRQVYQRLELCICDNGSGRQHVSEVLEDYAATGRVSVRRLSEKQSWAGACNEAISMTTGEFVALLEGGDEIAPEAIFRVVEFLQSVPADVVYTDEDRIDVGGRRADPVFKPYWSPDLLLSTAYVGRLCVLRRSIIGTAQVFREGFRGGEEHDLALRLSEKTDRIYHLPEVLYHRRKLPIAPGDPESRGSPRAIEEALDRRGVDATVEPGVANSSYRVIRRGRELPKVSIVVHAPEGWPDWSLVDRLEEQTAYPIHRIVEASFGRTEHPPVASVANARVSHPLPARALNLAAREAGGEYLVFMDASTQTMDPGWLLEMLGHAQRQEVGAVGCKVMGLSGGLRHGGSLIAINQLIGDPREHDYESSYYLPLIDHTFNFGSASAECMMVRSVSFLEAGGFDDANLPNAFYDLDLSFRFRENGLLNVYTPYALIVCEGSHKITYVEEIEYMWNRWWGMVVQALHYRTSPLDPTHHGFDKEAIFVLQP